VKHIPDGPVGEFEQLVLLAILRLGEETYGAEVKREIEVRTGRRLAISAVYITLDRLEQKGYIRTWIGDPLPQRGGRRRKHIALLPAGGGALARAYRGFREMTAGLEPRLERLKP
jgi:PadR family transcriptional regulator, regulatory protein PadR